jgi:hypothetical protein
MLNLVNSYFNLGRHQDALEKAYEAQRILQAALPPSHVHVQKVQQLIRLIEGIFARPASRR